MSDGFRTYRFLVTDRENAEEQPRELFLTLPEMDDLSHEHASDLLGPVGAEVRGWYRDRHGFQDPEVRCGGPVDLPE